MSGCKEAADNSDLWRPDTLTAMYYSGWNYRKTLKFVFS